MPTSPTPRWLLLVLAALALASQACSTAAPTPPATPPPARAQTAPPEAEQEPYHVAPPPAYGHKVVLADGSDRGND